MSKRRICVVTGTRAEYGLLRWIMKGIKESPLLDLQVVATGMHLSPEFGMTHSEIEGDGFTIDKKLEMVLSADSPSAIAKSTGLGMIGFADVLSDLQPDVIILLGDRYELLAAAFAAVTARIPIAHIHGGETTEGAFDEAIRHSITKMALWHFVAADEYEKRVIQLGENPKRVFNVGGLGVDSIKKIELLSKQDLEEVFKFKFGKKNLMVTFHPVTLEKDTSQSHFKNLLDNFKQLKDTNIIFTYTNSDTNGRIINSMINHFVNENAANSIAFASIGQKNYLSALQFVDGVVGNSSSGLLEAPSFKIGTVNIGDRQKGRMKAKSVIDCDPTKESIKFAINKLYNKEFQHVLSSVINPYGEGGSAEKILKILQKVKITNQLKKEFYDN